MLSTTSRVVSAEILFRHPRPGQKVSICQRMEMLSDGSREERRQGYRRGAFYPRGCQAPVSVAFTRLALTV
jgi:hypothetical protein